MNGPSSKMDHDSDQRTPLDGERGTVVKFGWVVDTPFGKTLVTQRFETEEEKLEDARKKIQEALESNDMEERKPIKNMD